MDEIAVPHAAAWGHDIRIGRRQVGFSTQGLHPLLIFGALSTVLALALIAAFKFLVFAPAATAIEHKFDCLNSDATRCVGLKSDREAIHATPKIQSIAAPAEMKYVSEHAPSNRTTAAFTNTVTPATQRKSPGPRAVVVQHEASLPRQVPVPETKPDTIEGWTVHEVDGRTAVLDGPNGQWRATSGDTVPGLGKIDSIVHWGSRWIVATSKGLVSTP